MGYRGAGIVLGRRTLFAPGLALSQSRYFVAVQGSCLGIVSLLDRLVLLPVRLVFEELTGPLITTSLHLFQLQILPLVHGDTADEGQVHSQATVLAAALQTDPDAIGHRHPLGVVGTTLEAFLRKEIDGVRGQN